MKVFTRESGVAAPLARDHIDTDAIIAKQHLKVITKSGLGRYLFSDWRYLEDETPNAEFVLNQPCYQQAKFLISGENFGCGSSREHAVWALDDFGIRAVIAKSFGDIFYNNCFKNGVLPVQLPVAAVDELLARASKEPLMLTIDLQAQTIDSKEQVWTFLIDKALKKILLEGLDAIGQTLQHQQAIQAFERVYAQKFPWLFKGEKL
ncbi:3-isopropylmalate dehydratase small subunit [Rappaport israeli]|uniref:3-isopropylmalate dehydratase small subunit n=1 Tax=Rappaport israeli TaxID=1839807 RepID=UPI000931588B|nr:3-isopropylmalate dehydratase small subunit [Rappaport israeli]